MKRLHIHVAVDDLDRSIRFYSELFANAPVVRKPDYAKWMLEDPRVDFAISARGASSGIEHLGIQAENEEELDQVYQRLERLDRPLLDEGSTVCCYAKSQKTWVEDPQGVRWETFLTTGESTVYGREPSTASGAACCVPLAATKQDRENVSVCCTSEQRAQAKASNAACCA